jgi:hypothetical protein
MRNKEACLIQGDEEGFAQRDSETQNIPLSEVRSTVERHFQQMDQAHDRIRAVELDGRLAGRLID